MKRFPPLRRYAIAVLFGELPTDPRTALMSNDFLTLVLAGGLRAPAFDAAKVRRLLVLPPARFRGFGDDEQIEVRLLPPGTVQSGV